MNKYNIKAMRFLVSFLIIMVYSFSNTVYAQNKATTIYGNVADRKGVPLMGVEVTVQESVNTAITDEFGDFTLQLEVATKQVSFFAEGFKPLTTRVLNSDFLKIILDASEEGQGIYDMVYMPWKVTDKRTNTASVSTTTHNELRKSPVMSLSNAISGRLPGLTVIQEAGGPGWDKGTWRIRGVRTLENIGINNMGKGGSGSPIIIVDGFERDFTGFDPSEIESFSVLKDAAATAIYGVRGANGAILVTTKRGQENRRTISLELSGGIVTPDRMPNMLDSYQHASLHNEARQNDGLDLLYTPQDLELYKNGLSPLTHPNNNYYKEFVKPFTLQNKAALTLSGGNRIVRYFLAFSFNRQNGLFARTDENPAFKTQSNYTQYNLRANLDVTLAKNLEAAFTLSNRIEDRKYPYDGTNPVFNILSSYPPNAFPLDFIGVDPALNQDVKMLGGNATYNKNPLGMLSYRGNTASTNRFYQFGVALKHNMSYLTQGLSANFEFNYDGWVTRNVFDYGSYRVWDRRVQPDQTITYSPYNTESSLTKSTSSSATQMNGINFNFKYNRQFGDHKVDALLMFRRFSTIYKEANQSDYKVEDLAFRGTYSYKNRYFAEVTTTLSGAENFYYTPDKRVLFPAISAGWILSDEPFFGKSSLISFLKLRASWGLSGNDRYNYNDPNGFMYRYAYRDRWWTQSQQHIFGIAAKYLNDASREGVLPNKDFRIEKSSMYNVGLDAHFFKNKLTFSGDFFYENRYNIYTKGVGSIPFALGVEMNNLPIENKGEVHTRGMELQLGWKDRVGDFGYFITAYTDFTKNKIIEMSEPFKEDPYRVETGGIVGQDFGLVSLGLFKNQADIDNSPLQRFGPYQAGDIKYADLNKDGIVDENDITFIGKGNFPSINYAIDLGFSYKGFDMSMLFQGSSNSSIYLNNNAMRAFYNNGTISELALNRYTDEASWETATYPRLTTVANDNNWRLSTYWLKNASFLRLKNVEIGYNVPKRIMNKVGIDGLRIYLNGYNMFSIDNIKDFDPEDPSSGVSKYPQIKIFNLGLNFKF